MDYQQNLRVIFTNKADAELFDILKKYGLQESQEEIFSKLSAGKIPKKFIVKIIIETFATKTITKEDLHQAVGKVFRVDLSEAKKISDQIIKNLIPFLIIAPSKKFNDPDFREEISKKVEKEGIIIVEKDSAQEIILEKIRKNAPAAAKIPEEEFSPPQPAVKKIEVKDVEKNAEELKNKRAEEAKPGTTGGEIQRKMQPDKYRETVE